MATSTYLSNPALVEVGGVNLTDQCTAATMTVTLEELEETTFGSIARTYVKGLETNECTLTLYNSYATAETYISLLGLVGTQTTVKIKPFGGAESATNPILTLSNTYLASLPVANMSLGELSTIDVTFVGGTFSQDTTP
jgi:hypothetical protein